ncbi:MAG: TAXI family TRAP transporter solute-binding subunit [Actinobacteria bacterium]|nr:TAXI family TRAP transporter solute-binding subunit [Actinomycetota bacterium]
MVKKVCVLVVSITLVFMCLVSYAASSSIEYNGVWSSGGLGGEWFTQATGIAEIVKRHQPGILFKILPGGGVTNTLRVNSGEAAIGWSVNPALLLAKDGVGMFEEPCAENIRIVAGSFMDGPLNFLAAKETGVKTFDDFINLLKNKKAISLTTVSKMSTENYFLQDILNYYGFSFDSIRDLNGKVILVGYEEQADTIIDKHADFWFLSMGVPSSSIIRASSARDLVMVEYPKELIDYLISKFGFSDYTMPASAYNFMEKDINMVMWGCSIMANANVPDDVIYALTKAVCEDVESVHSITESTKVFKPETAGSNPTGLPMHPGAIQYYEDAGYEKVGEGYIKK